MAAAITPINRYSRSKNGVTPEVNSQLVTAQSAVQNLGWQSYVPFISDVLGYGFRPTEKLLDYSTKINKNAVAECSGHESIGDFISSAVDDFGLGMSWDDWTSSVKACIYRKMFSIHHSRKDDILAELSDIESYLGRHPKDAFEFQQVKTELLKKSSTDKLDEHRAEAASLRLQITDLEVEHNKLGVKIESLQQQKEELEQKNAQLEESGKDLGKRLETAISDLESLKETHQRELSAAVDESNKQLEEDLVLKFEYDTKQLHNLINSLQEELNRVEIEAAEELQKAEAIRQKESESFSAEREELQRQLESAYDRVGAITEEISQADKKIESLNAQLESKQSELEAKGEELVKLAQQAPEDTESLERIENLQDEVRILREETNGLSESLGISQSKLKKVTYERGRLIDYTKKLKTEMKSVKEESAYKTQKLVSANERIEMSQHKVDRMKTYIRQRESAKASGNGASGKHVAIAVGVAVTAVALLILSVW